MYRVVLGTLIAVSMALATITTQAQLVNGSFEDGNFTGINPFGLAGITDLNPGDTNMTGWTVAYGEITWQQIGYPSTQVPSIGTRWLDLTGGHDNTPEGGVLQTVSLLPGHSYTLGFDIGYNTNNPTSPDSVIASVAGVTQTFSNLGNGTGTNQWERFTLNFVPTSASNVISLQGSSVDGQTYIGLDNVTLVDNTPTATPEPGTIGLFLSAVPPAIVLLRWRRRFAGNHTSSATRNLP
jgi:hypothetical protein